MRTTAFFTALFVLAAGSVRGATFTVTRTDDRAASCLLGDCSLREAVNAANASPGADVINFNNALLGHTITLDSQIVISDAVTINGPSATLLTVSGNNATRIFRITASATISGITMSGGNATDGSGVPGAGGAISHLGTSLTLDTVRILNNDAAGEVGGAIYCSVGSMTILDSTISNNNAKAGGAIYFDGTTLKIEGSTFVGNHASATAGPNGGGAIYSDDPLVVSNCTFSGNSSSYAGGAIFFIGAALDTLTLRNSTIVHNTAAQYAGGVGNFSNCGGVVANNIIALNTATNGFPDYYDGGQITEITNYTGASPTLGPLADVGGPTQTYPLICGSPALNAGTGGEALDINGAALTTDQRGTGYARFSGTVDIGAYEAQGAPSCTPLPTPTNLVATASGTSQVNLTWNLTGNVASCTIERRSDTSPAWTLLDNNIVATNYVDTNVSASHAYAYRVQANNPEYLSSAFSKPDVSSTYGFAEDPVFPLDPVKALHITQLRSATDALRVACGLGFFPYTDASVFTTFPIRAVDVT